MRDGRRTLGDALLKSGREGDQEREMKSADASEEAR